MHVVVMQVFILYLHQHKLAENCLSLMPDASYFVVAEITPSYKVGRGNFAWPLQNMKHQALTTDKTTHACSLEFGTYNNILYIGLCKSVQC